MSENAIGTKKRPKWLVIVAIFAIIFGIVTIISGGKALFTDVGRLAAGNYVPFVLWFNFVSGFVYVVTGIGLAQNRTWSGQLAVFLTAAIILVFVFFGIHILMGGAYEIRTVFAMVLRSVFWLIVAKLSRFQFETGSSKI
ncbi:MAG: hypothetical protein IPK68_23275 [Bdellovibrionales bacterium]|nr:hypothetical protein [Bdellovibrionales bacterium]